MKKTEKIIRYVNLPRHICDAVLNKKHTKVHRISAGMVLMVIGVIIAKASGAVSITIIHIIGDAIGYGLHGIGITPIIEHFVQEEEEDEKEIESK